MRLCPARAPFTGPGVQGGHRTDAPRRSTARRPDQVSFLQLSSGSPVERQPRRAAARLAWLPGPCFHGLRFICALVCFCSLMELRNLANRSHAVSTASCERSRGSHWMNKRREWNEAASSEPWIQRSKRTTRAFPYRDPRSAPRADHSSRLSWPV